MLRLSQHNVTTKQWTIFRRGRIRKRKRKGGRLGRGKGGIDGRVKFTDFRLR